MRMGPAIGYAFSSTCTGDGGFAATVARLGFLNVFVT